MIETIGRKTRGIRSTEVVVTSLYIRYRDRSFVFSNTRGSQFHLGVSGVEEKDSH